MITDGARACSYDDLPLACGGVETFLAAAGLAKDACLAVRGGNTLTTALTALSLLKSGAGFALCSADQPVPPFCRYVLECGVTKGPSRTAAADWDITDCLQLRVNTSWNGADVSYCGRFFTRTSGTTADSKAIVFSHAKLWANARNCVDRFQLNDQERVAIPVPIWHMYGLGAALLPAVLARSSIDIQADSNVIRYLQRESEFEPTTVYLAPSFCYALTRLRQARRRYRLTIAAGDRTPADIFTRYEDAHGCLVSLYGSSELGAVAAGSPDDSFEHRCRTTGRPMTGVRISNSEQSHSELRELSTLRIDHPAGGDGYADERGEVVRTDDRFVDGRLKSNDVGRLDANGYVLVAGRSDHLVKRDGRFVAFSDVEEALLKTGAVEAVVVLSCGHTPRGAQLTAVCVTRGEVAADARSIREASRRHLPPYAIPDRVTFIETIPRLESGKPDRAALARYVADDATR
jgi:acyl-CoA synthetase (AMP-forming)/AMP-acid ligase II